MISCKIYAADGIISKIDALLTIIPIFKY
jgi:hypothetical protein